MAARLTTLVVAGIVAATLIAGLMVGAQRDDSDGPVDLIVHNGRVFAGLGQPFAEAVAIRGNQILRVGSEREILKLARPQTAVIDAGGGAVVPGFNDTGVRFLDGSAAFDGVDLREAKTLAEIERRVLNWAEANPDRPWIVGRGWRHEVVADAAATRLRLDRLVPDRPARILDDEGRTAWVNSRAFELAHLAAPAGRSEARQADSSGLLRGADAEAVARLLPQPTADEQARALRAAVADAHRVGITSVQDSLDDSDQLAAYDSARRDGDLHLRVYAALAVTGEPSDAALAALSELLDAYSDDPLLKAGAVTVTVDEDEPGGRAMLTDEVDPDSVPYSADQLNRLLRRIDARGWQIIARASGDRGVRMALDAFAHARRSNRDRRGERRHRLDGARFVTAPDLPRFDALGVLASLQPYHDPTPPFAGGARPIARPGPNPVPALAVAVGDEGGRIAFGSGWPAAPLNPLLGLGAALDGQPDADAVTASSRPAGLDLAAAIDAYTAAGAWASFDEQRKGSIEAGMLADIVILSDDIFDATSLEPSATHVSLTIFDGKVVYRRQGPTAE